VNPQNIFEPFGSTLRDPGIARAHPTFMLQCAARDLSCLGVALMTPVCQAGLERASWIKRLTFPQVLSYVRPTKMNAPACTPEYKTCEWNDDKAQNSPRMTNLKEVVMRFVQATGFTIRSVDERHLNSLTVEPTLA